MRAVLAARLGVAARRLAPPVAIYLAAGILGTWPLALRLASHLGAPEGPGDPYLNLWILGWDLQALTQNPLTLLDGRVFDARIFHPAAQTLAYSDHLLLQAVLIAPVYLLTGDIVISYNVLLVCSIVLSGLAMHACARGLGGSPPGAYLAGLAWALWPYRTSHLIHLQLQALYFLPLAVLALHRLVAALRRRDAIALGLAAGLQAVSAFYYGVMTMVALAVMTPALALSAGRGRALRLAARLLLAAVVGLLVVGPVVWPYWRMQRQEGFARNLYEASRHAAVAASYVQVPEHNLLYGRTHLLTARDRTGAPRAGRVDGVEQALFPGVVVLVLAGLGVAARRGHATRATVPGLLAVIAVGFILSLGPEGWRSVYAAAHRFVFGFQAVRAPARFGVLVMLGLAVLAAFGASALHRRAGRLVWIVIALAMLEYAALPMPMVPRPPRTSGVAAWLAAAQGDGAVVYLPLTNDRQNTVAMIDALGHGRPILNGYSGQRPAFFPALVDALATFPTADAVWTLRDFGVRFVVAPADLPPAISPAGGAHAQLAVGDTPLVERARVDGRVIYELVWTTEVEARLVPPAPPPPPPPGPLPFVVGERAEYEVGWVGGPIGVSAGQVVVQVEPPGHAGAAFRLVATAETAPWVSRFFQARDRYQTDATERLKPLVHARVQRQGRREIDRTFAFDAETGHVRISTPETAATPIILRVPPHTRDALTAFFYVRTLPLEPGTALTIAVNDGGRTRLVTIAGVARESITIAGRTTPAIRVEPRITERVPRRAPVDVVVWLSDDARRIVLAADVEAGFGKVRLELTEYRER